MKFVKRIVILFLILFFCCISFISVLFLNKNKYGVIEFGNHLYVTISENNLSNIYKQGSLIVVQKEDFSNLKENDQVFIYAKNDDEKNVAIISTKIKQIDYDKKNIVTEDTSKYYSEEFILGVPLKSYDSVGKMLELVMSKWFFFFCFLLPGFFVVLYEVYSIIIKVKFDDDEYEIVDTRIEENDDVEKLRQELASIKAKVIEKESKSNDNNEDVIDNNDDIEEKIIINKDELFKENIEETLEQDDVLPVELEKKEEQDENNDISQININEDNIEKIVSMSEKEEDSILENNDSDSAVVNDNIQDGDKLEDEESLEEENTSDNDLEGENDLDDGIVTVSDDNNDISNENEENTVQKRVTIIGKNETNIIKKGLLLVENEIHDLLLILSLRGENSSYYISIVNKITSIYIEDKYLGESYTTGNMKYKDSLIDDYKFNNISESSSTLLEIKNNLKIVNKIIDNYNSKDIEKYLDYIDVSIRDEIKNKIVLTLNKYRKIFDEYLNNIYSNDFVLCEEVIIRNKIKSTYVKCNAKFNKIFSDYAVEKSLRNNLVNENVDELQLKMLSFKLFSNMIKRENVHYQYLYYFKESFFKKSKKINSLLRDIDDNYSQERIIIAISYETLNSSLSIIKEFKTKGYRFAVEIKEADIDKINKDYLLYVDMIFVITEKTDKELYYSSIPFNMLNNLYLSKKTILHEESIR